MSTPTDPRFVILLAAPVIYRGVGPFTAVRVEIIDSRPGFSDGYRFRPLVDQRAEGAEEPVWVALPGEWFAAASTPSEAGASDRIEAFLAGPSIAEQLATAKAALKARATERRWQVETAGVTVGGVQVATDDRAKTLLTGADRVARRNPAYTTRWKGVDGTWADLDAATITAIADAVYAHVDACFRREEELHALIDAAADLAALDALKPTVEAFALEA